MESLHARLAEDGRLELRRHTRERRFGRSEVVFHEGDPGDSLHIVEQGLFVARSSSTLGNVLTVNVFRPGSVFGELAVLSTDTTRNATVVSIASGRTRSLRRADLEYLRTTRSVGRHIDEWLMDALVWRNRALTALVMELLFTPTPKRLARQLLRLDDLGLAADDDDGWIRVGQGELAMMTASTRATANRVLRDMERSGILELARGKVHIADRDRLVDRAK